MIKETELKLCDFFELPFSPIEYQNGIVDSNGFGVLFADMSHQEKSALCQAINNHDTLAQQRDKAVELLKRFLPMYYYDIDENELYIGGEFQYNEHDDSCMMDVLSFFGYDDLISDLKDTNNEN